MKKNLFFAAAVMGMMLTSCHSTESAYKKAYEKAKAQETAQQAARQEEPQVTPVQTTPAPVVNNTTPNANSADVAVRREKVTVVDGAPLKAYSVVVGAFSLKSNAEGVQQTLKNKGYSQAVIVRNEARGLYRVVAATYDAKADAVNARNTLRNDYADAWLLMNE